MDLERIATFLAINHIAKQRMAWMPGKEEPKTAKELEVKRRFIASNPLEEPYGGMPDGGEYEAYTEYEIGAQRIAEAAHCILGSLWKIYDRPSDRWSVERGHINEEFGIIEYCIKEYSRDLYSDRMTKAELMEYQEEYRDRHWKYVTESVENIKKVSPKLKALANRNASQLKSSDVPESIKNLGLKSYEVIEELADAMLKSVARWPDDVDNAFTNSKLRSKTRELSIAVSEWERSFKESSMDNQKMASELIKLAKELVAGSAYERTIEKLLKRIRRDDIDPRHVEGYLRLEFGTLDSLSENRMFSEIKSIVQDVDADPKMAEEVARSYGL